MTIFVTLLTKMLLSIVTFIDADLLRVTLIVKTVFHSP
jgi:hypothetical protein